MELFAQTVHGAILFLGQLVIQTRQLAQPDHGWLVELHRSKAVHVGAQCIGQNEGVAAIILAPAGE